MDCIINTQSRCIFYALRSLLILAAKAEEANKEDEMNKTRK